MGVATGEHHGDVAGDGVQLGDRAEPVPRPRPVPEATDQPRLLGGQPREVVGYPTRHVFRSSRPGEVHGSPCPGPRGEVDVVVPEPRDRPPAGGVDDLVGSDSGQVRPTSVTTPSAIRRSTGRSMAAPRVPGPTGTSRAPRTSTPWAGRGGLMGRVCWVGRRAARAPARSAASGSGRPWRPRRRGRPPLRHPSKMRRPRTTPPTLDADGFSLTARRRPAKCDSRATRLDELEVL